MNPQKIATALNTLAVGLGELAEGLGELSEALNQQPELPPSGVGSAGRAAPATGSPPATFEASPFEDVLEEVFPDQGSEAVCPKHRVPYTEGTYGPYCKQATDDPAWGKQKGDRLWCRISPKNAAEYMRVRAAA